jgi:hypothetical protein
MQTYHYFRLYKGFPTMYMYGSRGCTIWYGTLGIRPYAQCVATTRYLDANCKVV